MSVRQIRNLVGQSLIATLLFAQGALALAACDWARRAPALAITQAEQSSAGCMEQMQNANLCVAHCLGEDQSSDTPQVAVPAWGVAPVLVLKVVDRAAVRAAILRDVLPHAGAPPLRILFHSFLI